MNVTFVNPGVDYMISRILEFQAEGSTAFWSDPLFHFFPELDKAHADSLPFLKRREYIEHTLREIYPEIEETIHNKVFLYSQYWDVCRLQISDALSDAFGVDCSGLFNDLQCNVTMNPIEPHFLKEH